MMITLYRPGQQRKGHVLGQVASIYIDLCVPQQQRESGLSTYQIFHPLLHETQFLVVPSFGPPHPPTTPLFSLNCDIIC